MPNPVSLTLTPNPNLNPNPSLNPNPDLSPDLNPNPTPNSSPSPIALTLTLYGGASSLGTTKPSSPSSSILSPPLLPPLASLPLLRA